MESIRWPSYFIALLWAIHLIQLAFGWEWGPWLAIRPGYWQSLGGILFTPLLHGSFLHLFSNSISLFILWSILLYFYPRVSKRSFLLIYFLSGLGLWAWGFLPDTRGGFHIGASGVVYGLMAFLLGNGLFRRNFKSIIIAFVVLFFYGGSIFMGLLPKEQVSHEGHWAGFIVGLFTSFFYKQEIEADEIEQPPSWEREGAMDTKSYFLPRDVFEKTKEERRREAEGPGQWTSDSSHPV